MHGVWDNCRQALQHGRNHSVHYPRHCERRDGKPTRIHAEKALRHGETEALGIKQNQLEALRGGFKLGRGARKRGRLLMQNIKSRRKRCIACDVVEHPANFEDKETTKSKPNEVGSIWKGGARERRRRIRQL